MEMLRRVTCALLTIVGLLMPATLCAQQIVPGSGLEHLLSEGVEQRFQKADHLRQTGRDEEGLTIIEEAVSLDGQCGKCFAILAAIECNLGKYRDGLEHARTGERLALNDRERAVAAYNRAANMQGLSRATEALQAYQESLKYDASFTLAHLGIAKALFQTEEYGKARGEFQIYLQYDPTHGRAWTLLGLAEVSLGLATDCLVSSEMAVRFAPNDDLAFVLRALALGLTNDSAGMLEAATKALALNPTRPTLHILRAHALQRLGRLDEAAAELALEPDRDAVEQFLRLLNKHDENQIQPTPSIRASIRA